MIQHGIYQIAIEASPEEVRMRIRKERPSHGADGRVCGTNADTILLPLLTPKEIVATKSSDDQLWEVARKHLRAAGDLCLA